MNDIYEALFLERAAAAIGAAKAAKPIKHRSLKGAIREILIRDLFRPLLPLTMGVGTGLIVTSRNKPPSAQQDVVIYERGIMPPVLFEETLGIFPIESVLATVEVKTKLTLPELRSAYKNATTINEYSYLEGRRKLFSGEVIKSGRGVKHLIAAIFALQSTKGDEIKRYTKLHSAGDSPIKAICVADKSYCVYKDGCWKTEIPDPAKKHQEVVFFLAGLLSALHEVRATRGSPSLEDYVR